MNTKYSPQDLATFFAQYQGISKKNAEAFIRSFFDTVESGLIDDKFVKIKGFGTFKIIIVGERESINVNTGERIQISSHPKITFTPDTLLKESINKPFAQFQTVTLNEDIKDSDLAEIDSKVALEIELAEKEATKALVENETTAQTETSSQNEEDLISGHTILPENSVSTEDILIKEESNCSVSPEVKKSSKREDISSLDNNLEVQDALEQEKSPLIEIPEGTSFIPTNERHSENYKYETDSMDNAEEDRIEEQKSPASHSIIRLLKVVSVILCSLTLLTAFYFAGYYHIFGEHMETAKISTMSNHTASAPQASSTTAPANSSQRKSTKTKEANKPDDLPQTTAPAASLTPQLRPEDKYAQMEGSNYKIVGVIGIHKLQSGENLYRLAKQTYGDCDFAKYIIFFNKIENPDIITIGSVIKLPQLEKKN